MECFNQRCAQQLARCDRLIRVLDKQNLDDVLCVLSGFLNEIELEKQNMVDNGYDYLYLETFNANMRIMRMLLEYSEIFTLIDVDRYRETCAYFLNGFRMLFTGEDDPLGLSQK